MTRAEIVIEVAAIQPVLQEINALETRIVASEDEADEALWEQAGRVVAALEGGMSQRQLAAGWINGRTKEPYSQMHVSRIKQLFETYKFQDPRPRFRDVYNEIANAKTVHVSQNSGDNEWYTPSEYLEAARQAMGGIDCDPASSAIANELVKAPIYFDQESNGLLQQWSGNVWLNPPYAQPLMAQFASAVVAKYRQQEIQRACVLVNNATETDWFQQMLGTAAAVCFPRARIRFLDPEGAPSGAPLQGQAVLYMGAEPAAFAEAFGAFGPVLCRLP